MGHPKGNTSADIYNWTLVPSCIFASHKVRLESKSGSSRLESSETNNSVHLSETTTSEKISLLQKHRVSLVWNSKVQGMEHNIDTWAKN
jgi:hypothetical protein